jgi:hypothetical protein
VAVIRDVTERFIREKLLRAQLKALQSENDWPTPDQKIKGRR